MSGQQIEEVSFQDLMNDIRKLFDQYAKKDGNPETLTKKELALMFGCDLKDKQENKALDTFLAALDADGNGVVDFKEFLTFFIGAMNCM